MFWVMLGLGLFGLIIAARRGWQDLGDIHETSSTVSMHLPNPTQQKAGKERRTMLLAHKLTEFGISPSAQRQQGYIFTLPHATLPLTLEASSSATNSILKVSGSLPSPSTMNALTISAGYHTEPMCDAPPQVLALFEQGGVKAHLFEEHEAHKTTQCNLNTQSKLSMTLTLPQNPNLEDVCAWLAVLQDDLSRSPQDWNRELLRRVYHATESQHAILAMQHLLDWYPDDVTTLLQSTQAMNAWACVTLLEHHYTRGDRAMPDDALEHLTQIVSQTTHEDALRIKAMKACVEAPHTPYPRPLFSNTSLELLAQHPNPSDEFITLLARLEHARHEHYHTQHDLLLTHLERLSAERAESLMVRWLEIDRQWCDHAMVLDTSSKAESVIGELGSLLVFGGSIERITALSHAHLTRAIITDASYIVWEQLARHRHQELGQDISFMTWLTKHINAKRQRHTNLFRFLILDLHASPYLEACMTQILGDPFDPTPQMWERHGSLFCEHLIDREDLLSISLKLLTTCPVRDTAVRLAARLPTDNEAVQDFLATWPWTPRSARVQAMQALGDHPGLLTVEKAQQLVDFIKDTSRGSARSLNASHMLIISQALGVLAHRGPAPAIHMLMTLRALGHTRPIHAAIDETIETLRTRFNAQGGELTLSAEDPIRGALSLPSEPRS